MFMAITEAPRYRDGSKTCALVSAILFGKCGFLCLLLYSGNCPYEVHKNDDTGKRALLWRHARI